MTDGTFKKLRAALVLILLLTVAAWAIMSLTGCFHSPQKVADARMTTQAAPTAIEILTTEVDGLKADLLALSITDPGAAATAEDLIALITEKSEAADKWIKALADAQATLKEDQSAWGLAEMAVGAASIFFPGAVVGIPILRRSRAAFEGVVASMAAGGGPKDPKAARDFMNTIPGLKKRVTAHRELIKDKVAVSVKPSDIKEAA